MAQMDESEIDVEAALNELDRKLSRLRVLYEQYFMGIEKRQPTVLQKDVVRSLRVLENLQMRNTAAKFRLRQMVQKFHSYRAYWLRTARQIEEGTYRKHKQKVKNKVEREKQMAQREEEHAVAEAPAGPAAPPPEPEEKSQVAAEAGALADEFLRSLGAGVAAPSKPKGPPPAVRGMSAEEVKKKDAKLRALKAKLGLDPNAPITSASREKLAQSLPRQGSGARYRVPGTPGAEDNLPSSERTIRPSRRSQMAKAAAAAPGSRPLSGASQPIQRSAQPIDRPKPAAARPKPAPKPAPAKPSRVQQAAKEAGISGDRVQRIYQSLVDAKRRTGESTSKLSVDSVAKSIAKQAPALRKKYGTDKVDFQVVIKGGKAYLKPQTDKK